MHYLLSIHLVIGDRATRRPEISTQALVPTPRVVTFFSTPITIVIFLPPLPCYSSPSSLFTSLTIYLTNYLTIPRRELSFFLLNLTPKPACRDVYGYTPSLSYQLPSNLDKFSEISDGGLKLPLPH